MQMRKLFDRPIRFEFVSSDATTAAPVTLYDDRGQAVTLLSNHQLVVADIDIVVGAAMTVDVFDDCDNDGVVDAGERLVSGSFAANGGIARSYTCGKVCKPGSTPKVRSSTAGDVRITGSGFITTTPL